MSEQEVNRWIFKNGPEHREYVKATDYDALQSRLDAAEREKSALRHALDVKEEFYQDALHSHIVLNAKVAKRDAVLRETADSLRCSKVFPALLESIDALLSSAEPVKCRNCDGHGVIGWTTGQTAESFDQGEALCSECDGTGEPAKDGDGEVG